MKRYLRSWFCMVLAVLMLLPALAVHAEEGDPVTVQVPSYEEVFYEDHEGKNMDALIANNDTEHTHNGKTPLNNLYDQKVVGTGYTNFATEWGIKSKKVSPQGNHAADAEADEKWNMFCMSNNDAPQDEQKGTGFLTVVPKSVMDGMDNFTVSYFMRQYQPTGSFGLALFYQAENVDGIDYFNGYDNFTYTGFCGLSFEEYETWSVYNAGKTSFEGGELEEGHRPAKNKSVYVSVTATKGEFTVDGKSYTAKVESYVDDILVATSYAQWADAPVMFYYDSPAMAWSVQFTNVKVETNKGVDMPVADVLEQSKPLAITGTAVRYDGDAGLRFYMTLEKEVVYQTATAVETGVLMLESSAYTGELTLETEGILQSAEPRTVSDSQASEKKSYAFLDASIAGKTYYARGYVKYTLNGQDFVYYTDVEQASCAITAAKVLAAIAESDDTAEMLEACRKIAGNIVLP